MAIVFFALVAATVSGAAPVETKLTLSAPEAQSVVVMGSWNNWGAPVKCVRESFGTWTATMSLEPGQYQYKFVVDDSEWIIDPLNPLKAADGLGGENSVVEVKSASRPAAAAPAPVPSAPAAASPSAVPTAATPRVAGSSSRGTVFAVSVSSAAKVDVVGSWDDWRTPVPCAKGADGKWRATVNLQPGEYQYVIVTDGEWNDLQKITVSGAAEPRTSPQTTPAASSQSAAPAASAPAATPAPQQKPGVEFVVEAPGASKVDVMGAWNSWSAATELSKGTDGKWRVTMQLQPGEYEYKFRQDGDWDKLNKDNRKIAVGSDGRERGASSAGASAQAATPAPQSSKPGVELVVEAPGANKVDVMGAWNAWSAPTELSKGSDGKWRVTMQLQPGEYEYKFRQDGDWDKLNTDNRKVVVGQDGREVRSSSGASASSTPAAAAVSIPPDADFTKTAAVMTADEKVIIGYVDPFANSVSVGSDFNGWDPGKTKLVRNAEGIWVASVTVKEGRYGWKFVVDGQWENGDNRRLTIVRGKGGKLELLPDQPTFNTPYNSRIFFSGRMYGQAVLRSVPDGEPSDTGRTRFAPLEYNLMPRMLFTVGENITGFMEAEANQHEGRFELSFNEGEVTLDEGWGRASIFRRRRITDFDDPMRLLDPFRDTLKDDIYFTNEERPAEHRFGRKFDDVRRNTDDNYTGYTLSGWQGLYGELNLSKWKVQLLGSDHIINQEDLWGGRVTWTGRFLKFGASMVHNEKSRGLIAERNWTGGDTLLRVPLVDGTGGYFTYPGSGDHYSYDTIYHFTPNGRNYDQWVAGDIRVGIDTRHIFGELAGRRKEWAFLAYENGDGLRPNGTTNYFSWSYMNPGEYLIGGREDDLIGTFGIVYFPFAKLGLEASYRIDDGTALTLDRTGNLVNAYPNKNTLTLRGRFKSDRFSYGVEAVHRTVTDFPNAMLQADFDNYDFADITAFGASDMFQFKQDIALKLGRWSLTGSHRYRDYTIYTRALQTMELKGMLGYDLTRRINLSLSGRLKTYALPNDPTLTSDFNTTKRYYELGGRLNYAISKYVNLNFGIGVNQQNDEDIEEGQLFFLRTALARARRGPKLYGGVARSRVLDQVLEAERILSVERRFEFNIDARF